MHVQFLHYILKWQNKYFSLKEMNDHLFVAHCKK